MSSKPPGSARAPGNSRSPRRCVCWRPFKEVSTIGPRQLANGKEIRPGRQPGLAIEGQGTGGDDTVQVDVVLQLLVPRMQHRGEARHAPQAMLGIGGEA